MGSPSGSMGSPEVSERDTLLRSPQRSLSTLVVTCVLGVCVLALAVSTRPAEFDSVSRFSAAEHLSVARRALLPASLQTPVLHAEQQLDGGDDGQAASSEPLSSEEIQHKAMEWVKENPEEGKRIAHSVLLGLCIGLGGTVALLWSEIAAVMTVRDLDACSWSGEPKPRELLERESMWASGWSSSLRPYLSVLGIAAILAGWLVACVPLCSVLADFGMPAAAQSADCVTSMVFLSVLNAFSFAALATGVCWTCTRPWAALILTLIALWGNLAGMVMHPFFTIAWAVVSAAVLVYYLMEVPESKAGHRRPPDIFSFGAAQRYARAGQQSRGTEAYV